MYLNNLQSNEFDYSLLDVNTANKLREYDRKLNDIYNNYSIEVGEVLYRAHQEFANPRDGTFLDWVEYKGIKTQNAYNYINIYKAFQSLESNDHKEIFQKQSKSLQIEMSKPSANPELNQKVLDGDITTHKKYKEIERKLREKESQLEQAKKSEQIAIGNLEREQNREPQIIKEPYIPDDYQQLEEAERQLRNENRQLSEQTNHLKERLERIENDRDEVERLERTIKQLDQQKAKVNSVLDANDRLVDLEKEFHAFFDKNMSPLKYKPLVNELYEFNGTERMKELVNLARAWVEDMERMLPSGNRKIVEGEIIND